MKVLTPLTGPQFRASQSVAGSIATYLPGATPVADLLYNATGYGDVTLVTGATPATVAASFWYWNGAAYSMSAQINTDGTYVAGSSTYGPTSAVVNGSLTCAGWVLGSTGPNSTFTFPASDQAVFYCGTVPVALITNTGNLQFAAGTFSGPAFKIVPGNSSGYTYRNAANTTSPMILTDAGALTILSTATKPGGGLWTATSDERVKKDIEPHTDGLSAILSLEPIVYRYNGKAGTIDDGKQYVGLSAQKVKDVLPRAVDSIKTFLLPEDEFTTDIMSVDSSELIFTLVNAVKELNAEIKVLKQEKKSFWHRLFSL